jgi:predicted dehydrogenase
LENDAIVRKEVDFFMVRIALVGTGWQGQGHLNTLKQVQGVELVGICDMNVEMLEKAAEKFQIPGFNDYVQMLEEAKPDGVIICTPPAARLELVRESAERGIHCFIEKPPAKDLEMANQVSEILEKTGVINSVGFMHRYSGLVDRCKELIAGKKIALVRSAMLDGLALRPNWPRWFFDKARSGGPAFDQAIHIFDLSRYLVGEVAQVSGFQGNLVVPKGGDFTVEDSFSLSLQYEGGILQNHAHSWVYPDYVSQIELVSDELHVTLDFAKGSLTGNVDGETISFQTEDALYQQELEAFVQAIREGRQDLIRSSYKDSIKSLSVALAAMEALDSGTVVKI